MTCRVTIIDSDGSKSKISIARSYNETAAQNTGNGTNYATANVVDFSNGTIHIQDNVSIASNEITIEKAGDYLIEFTANIKDGGTGNTRYDIYIGDGASEIIFTRSDVVNNRQNTIKTQIMKQFLANDTLDFRMRSFDAVENGTLAGFSIVIIPV